jgi:hypothetical protein
MKRMIPLLVRANGAPDRHVNLIPLVIWWLPVFYTDGAFSVASPC